MNSFSALILVSALCCGGTSLANDWEYWFANGKTDGFLQKGGKQVFLCDGKELQGHVVAGERNGFLCTEKTYGDFELEYEAWIDARQNSGVQIRSECGNEPMSYTTGSGKTMIRPSGVVYGYQVELDPAHPERTADIYDEERRGWLSKEKTDVAAAFRRGTWNTIRVVCRGDHLQTWLNGTPVADLHDNMTPRGFIGFQVHASRVTGLAVKWRNVRFRDLQKKNR